MAMLTTVDNPFNPFTQYDEWLAYDEQSGYNTNEYLARIANTNPAMTDDEVGEAINSAIDRIVKIDPFGLYIKVNKSQVEDNDI